METRSTGLVVAELLRDLNGGRRYAFVDLSLRDPAARTALPVESQLEPASYGAITARWD